MAAASLAEVTLGRRGRQVVLVGRSLEQTRGTEGELVNRGATMRARKKDAMRTNARKTVLLGELVVAAFDIAAQYSADPRVVSLLATRTVMRVLGHARKTSPRRHVTGPLLLGSFGDLLAFEATGRQSGALTIKGGVGAVR